MSNNLKDTGAFVISLDFELMWGMFDKVSHEDYEDTIKGTQTAIPRLLDVFKENEIHATWATVGMLAGYHLTDLEEMTPIEPDRPNYTKPELSSYLHLGKIRGSFNEYSELYLAPEMIEKINNTPGQEVGSHTFSHYYCLEDQEDRDVSETFKADAIAQHEAMSKFKIKPKSIVFPRNQWTEEALDVLRRLGYTSYRGNENHVLYRARNDESQTSFFIRLFRLLDTYFNISGHHTYKLKDVNEKNARLINIPASRFLRPHSKILAIFNFLKIRRIKKSMTKAAKKGEVFHLWWHPHNFGRNQNKNFLMLEKIIKHYHYLNKRYFWESANMSEVAESTKPVLEPNQPTS